MFLILIGGFCLHVLERQYLTPLSSTADIANTIFVPSLSYPYKKPTGYTTSDFVLYSNSIWCALVTGISNFKC